MLNNGFNPLIEGIMELARFGPAVVTEISLITLISGIYITPPKEKFSTFMQGYKWREDTNK